VKRFTEYNNASRLTERIKALETTRSTTILMPRAQTNQDKGYHSWTFFDSVLYYIQYSVL